MNVQVPLLLVGVGLVTSICGAPYKTDEKLDKDKLSKNLTQVEGQY